MVRGFTPQVAQAAAAAIGMPFLANVFYYGKEYRSPKQKVKNGQLQQAGYREHSVTDFQEEPWQAAAAIEDAESSPTGVDVDRGESDNAPRRRQQDDLVAVLGGLMDDTTKQPKATQGAQTQPAMGQDVLALIASLFPRK